ncbi:MAG: S8 family serine peptidase [Planctomycetota bacterium]
MSNIVMNNLIKISTFLGALCPLLAGAAKCQEPPLDAVLEPGQAFIGKHAFSGDVDRVQAEFLPGSRLSASAVSAPGFRVHPKLELWKDGVRLNLDSFQRVTKRNGLKQRICKIPVAEGGTYELRVTGGESRLGTYRLVVREQLPTKISRKLKLHEAETETVQFPARSGAQATVVLTTKKGGAPLLIPEVRGPGGLLLSLDELLFVAESGRRVEIGPIPLNADGVYSLLLTGAGTQAVRAVVQIQHQAPSECDVAENQGHATASGSVTLGDGFWLSGGTSGSFSEDGDLLAGELVVQLEPGEDASQVAAELGCSVVARAPDGWWRLRLLGRLVPEKATAAEARLETSQLCARAMTQKGVRVAEPNRLRATFDTPSDPLYPQQWDMRQAGFEAAWALEGGSPSGIIAVLDTGIRSDHPDFAGRLSSGYDFVGDAWNAGDGNGIDSNPTDPFVSMGTHGTHVAGTLAAATNNGLGVAGGTSSGMIMPVRVLGLLGGTDFDIAQGILYAAGLPNASGFVPPVRAEVINMSLGGPSYSSILHQAVRDAVEAGVIVVAAAGNANSTVPMYPAAFPESIAVSATDAADNRTYYSSYGSHVDLAAPGGDRYADLNQDGYPDGILSTVVDPALGATYAQKTGTSMAAPHVAALAFLLRSVDPNLTPTEVETYLEAGAIDRGSPGWDPEYGFGRIDAGQSVAIALGLGSGPADPFVGPSRIAFSSDGEVRQFAVVNRGGGGPVQVLSVTSSVSWIQPMVTSGQTPCSLDVAARSGGMLPGVYQSLLTIQTSAGTNYLSVELNVEEGGPVGVQTVHVLAVDVITGETSLVLNVTEETADEYVLDPLPEGTYRIVATTDLDHDGIAGEVHDYSGEAVDAETGKPKLILSDGTAMDGLSITLVAGGGGSLPGGGNIQIN